MEFPGSGYFYSLAALSMAFVGFTSIVVVLHQGYRQAALAIPHSDYKSACGTGSYGDLIRHAGAHAGDLWDTGNSVWQASSAIMLVVLVPWLLIYPKRRRAAAPGEKTPARVYIMTILGVLAAGALCLNLSGWVINPGPGPLAFTTVYVLSFASVAFVRTYSLFLRD